jgi:hypothetical protein
VVVPGSVRVGDVVVALSPAAAALAGGPTPPSELGFCSAGGARLAAGPAQSGGGLGSVASAQLRLDSSRSEVCGSDGVHVSQGQMCAIRMALGSTELGVDGSTLTRSAPPPYKWLWLPAGTLDLAFGFPATQCDIWKNYKRARSIAPRSVSPGEESSAAMDRDR